MASSPLLLPSFPLSRYQQFGTTRISVLTINRSQLLAEYDFPPSGLSRLESVIPLPIPLDSFGEPTADETQMLFFLALVSCRRLLNRIHLNLYARGRVMSSQARTGKRSQLYSRLTPVINIREQ